MLQETPALPYYKQPVHATRRPSPSPVIIIPFMARGPLAETANSAASSGGSVALSFLLPLLLSATFDAAYVEWRPLPPPPPARLAFLTAFYRIPPSSSHFLVSCSCAVGGDGRSVQVYVCGERLALGISYGEQWGAFVKDRHGGKLRSSNDDGDNDVESEGKVYMLQKGSTTISMLTQHNTTRFCNPPPQIRGRRSGERTNKLFAPK